MQEILNGAEKMEPKPKLDRFKLFDLVECAAMSWRRKELKKILPVVLTASTQCGGNLTLSFVYLHLISS